MGKLNPKQVENLTEPGTYEDGDGLRLVVKPTGRKSWLLRFQLAGRRREMGLETLDQYLPTVKVEDVESAGGYCEYPICYNSSDEPVGIR
jgi:hypothetical protein